MWSVYQPFCVSGGLCKDAVWRRRCPSVQHPAALSSARLGVLVSSFTPIHSACEGKRRFAAAAVGGRKITHPGKAILAGKCLSWCSFDRQAVVLVASQSCSCLLCFFYSTPHNTRHTEVGQMSLFTFTAEYSSKFFVIFYSR